MFERYTKLKNAISSNNYNELSISFDYQKERINYVNGSFEKSGLYVYIKPIKRTNGIVSCTFLSASQRQNGFKIKVLEMNRNNRKKIEKYSQLFTDEHLSTIGNLYDNNKFSDIVTLVTDLAKQLK